MDSKIEKGNWKEQKVKLKQKIDVLTDMVHLMEDSEKSDIFGKLQVKLGKSEEELRKILENL